MTPQPTTPSGARKPSAPASLAELSYLQTLWDDKNRLGDPPKGFCPSCNARRMGAAGDEQHSIGCPTGREVARLMAPDLDPVAVLERILALAMPATHNGSPAFFLRSIDIEQIKQALDANRDANFQEIVEMAKEAVLGKGIRSVPVSGLFGAFGSYIEALHGWGDLLSAVKKALDGGMAHSRQTLTDAFLAHVARMGKVMAEKPAADPDKAQAFLTKLSEFRESIQPR